MTLSDNEVRCRADKKLWARAKAVRRDRSVRLRVRIAAALVAAVFYVRWKTGRCAKPPRRLTFALWKACGPNVHTIKESDPNDPLNDACIEHDKVYSATK
jgi:hypothetical protein